MWHSSGQSSGFRHRRPDRLDIQADAHGRQRILWLQTGRQRDGDGLGHAAAQVGDIDGHCDRGARRDRLDRAADDDLAGRDFVGRDAVAGCGLSVELGGQDHGLGGRDRVQFNPDHYLGRRDLDAVHAAPLLILGDEIDHALDSQFIVLSLDVRDDAPDALQVVGEALHSHAAWLRCGVAVFLARRRRSGEEHVDAVLLLVLLFGGELREWATGPFPLLCRPIGNCKVIGRRFAPGLTKVPSTVALIDCGSILLIVASAPVTEMGIGLGGSLTTSVFASFTTSGWT